MKFNLQPFLERDLDLVTTVLLQSGRWKQIDCHAFESIFCNRTILIALYPELLEYTYVYRPGYKEKEAIQEDCTEAWIACKATILHKTEEENRRKSLEELKNWLCNDCILKPFRDEDAYLGIYKQQQEDFVFYINPNYPNGWWDNHTL